MATITTDQQLQQEVGALAGAGIPAAVPVTQTIDPGEIQGTVGTQIGAQTPAPTTTAATTGTIAPLPTPSGQNIGQIANTSLAQVTPQIGTMQAAQITQPVQVDMTGVQAGPSAGAIGTAATQQLDQRATTQYQLGQLMNSIQQGQPMPRGLLLPFVKSAVSCRHVDWAAVRWLQQQ